MSTAIAERRRRLAKGALKQGRKLYREKPGGFAKRIRKRFGKRFA